MPRAQSCFCILLWLAFSGINVQAQTQFFRSLRPIPSSYPIGLKRVPLEDESRISSARTDAFGNPSSQARERSISVLLWYPSQATSSRPLDVFGYLETSAAPHNDQEVPAVSPPELETAFLGENSGFTAVVDAPARKGRFPVVIYAPSFSASAAENADLCEQIASAGYIVIAAPSRGAVTSSMTADQSGLTAQARDISFLLGYMKQLPSANLDEVAVVGYSWGGLANIYAAGTDDRIRALVSLDGSIRYYVKLATDAGIHPEQMSQPLLLFTQGSIPLESDLVDGLIQNGDKSLVKQWTHADFYRVEMNAMGHAAFASMNERDNSVWSDPPGAALPGYERSEAATSYGWVVRYTIAFLNAYLKQDPQDADFIKRQPQQNGVPAHLLSITPRQASGIPLTVEAFRSALRKQHFQDASGLLSDIRTKQPDFTLDEQSLLEWGHDGLLDQGHVTEALEVGLVGVELHPASSAAYSFLGDVHLGAGKKAIALEDFRKAVQLDHENYHALDEVQQLGHSTLP